MANPVEHPDAYRALADALAGARTDLALARDQARTLQAERDAARADLAGALHQAQLYTAAEAQAIHLWGDLRHLAGEFDRVLGLLERVAAERDGARADLDREHAEWGDCLADLVAISSASASTRDAEIARLRAGIAGLRRDHAPDCMSIHDRHCACGARQHNRALDALLGETDG